MTKGLRILVLGATGYIGPHFVQAALTRGHAVAILTRGSERVDLPETVEQLRGDRNGVLMALVDREWDAVLDLATYVPRWLRTLGPALGGRVGHYTYISSIAAYKYPGASDETSELLPYAEAVDPYSFTERTGPYGALKVLCEREVETQFPQRTLIVRPGHIVGPGDRLGTLNYWIARMQQGGRILAGGDPTTQVQLIDVRDLAEWVMRMVEDRATGVFNAVGPALPLSWAEMLGAIRAMFSVPTSLTWVDDQWLADRGVSPFSCLRLWSCEVGQPGFTRLSNSKARASGLQFRPFAQTLADTLVWYRELPIQRQQEVLLGFDQLNQPLQYSMDREVELLAAWTRSDD